MRTLATLGVCLWLSLCLCPRSHAQCDTGGVVYLNGEATDGTIQEAIDVAVAGDEISVGPGIHCGFNLGGLNVTVVNHGLYLDPQDDPFSAANLAAITPLDATVEIGITLEGGEDDAVIEGLEVRGWTVAAISCTDADATIRTCRIRNNAGSGIAAVGSAATIDDCEVFGNGFDAASGGLVIRGGGIHADDSSLDILGCTIWGKGASVFGGGIDALGDYSLLVVDCTIGLAEVPGGGPEGNYALFGGGINLSQGSPTDVAEAEIVNCVIENNEAGSGGGLATSIDTTIRDCTFQSNLGSFTGGGISVLQSTDSPGDLLSVTGCLFDGNSSDFYGGAIAVTHQPDPPDLEVDIVRCVLTGNTVADGTGERSGGAVAGETGSGMISLTHCTLVDNTSEADCGTCADSIGLRTTPAGVESTQTVVLLNSIVWYTGAGPYDIFEAGMGTISATYSDIYDGFAGTGNIDEDPLFIDPENEDYGLPEGSPCVDAGDPASPLDVDNTVADMGAYFYLHYEFLRGNFDGVGTVIIVDALLTLQYLFQDGADPACFDAADADDMGTISLVDALRTLNYLFNNLPAPPDPGPTTCGLDPTPDGLGCVVSSMSCD